MGTRITSINREMTHSSAPYSRRLARLSGLVFLFLVCSFLRSGDLVAQDLPPQRQVRTYIPPEQIVNFLPTTPLNTFVQGVNPIFMQALGKRIIDPENRETPIGISVIGMYFFDAFEVVLEIQGLSYRETDQYFIIEEAPSTEDLMYLDDAQAEPASRTEEELATLGTREIQIEAIIFELNHTRARDLGVDWGTFFGLETQLQTSSPTGIRPKFFLRTDNFFDDISEWIIAPDVIDLAVVNRFFRFIENEGAGKTLAQPSIAVQSGQEGRIQIGSDVPVTTRDFAGNTLVQFAQTGIIVEVTPSLISEALSDTTGSPVIDFMHLDVRVERSNGRPFGGSIAIDRSQASTQILLLDGESTVLGGLYTTEESSTRIGIPILKDLPPWFLGLRYLFGSERKRTDKRELLIVLQAHLRDPIPIRSERARPRDLQNDYRRQVLETIRRFNEREVEEFPFKPEEQE